MRFKVFIIFTLTFLTMGCGWDYQSNDDEFFSEFPLVVSTSPSEMEVKDIMPEEIFVTFSEAMDTTSVTTNTLDTSCSGTFQVSSDNFKTCLQMSSSPTASNSNKTFSVTLPSSSTFNFNTTFKIRLTTRIKDATGFFLDQYEMINGFTLATFVAVGDSNIILSSPDGISWTRRYYGSCNDEQTRFLFYYNGTFYSVICVLKDNKWSKTLNSFNEEYQ